MTRALHGLGRLCAHHGLVVLITWVFLVVLLGLGVRVFGAPSDNNLELPGTGSQYASDVLMARFPPQQNGTNPIVYYSADGKLTDDAHKNAVTTAVKQLRKTEHVYSVINPISSKGQDAGLLSKDGKTGFAPLLLDVDAGAIDLELAEKLLSAATGSTGDVGVEVDAGGSIGSTLSEPSTESSEVVGIVAAMVILTLVLGSLVAMGLPILTAMLALGTGLSAIGLMGHLMGIPSIAPTVATMIGLGVGIDYALFLVTRHQDQLRRGMAMKDSIAEAVATSGSAIVFAGGTVVIALVSLAVADIPLVTAMGYAAAVAVLTAVLGAITLLPALLALVGPHIHSLAIPGFLHRREARSGGGFWASWSHGIARHPWIAIGVAAVILAPLIVPVFTLTLGQEDIGVTPRGTTERKAYDRITDGFGVGYNGPLMEAVVLKPVAKPSAAYEKKYNRAERLQKELTKEQKQLTAQQASLEQQQASLERQQQVLEAQANALTREQAQLLTQEATLEAEKARLVREGDQLAQQQAALQAEAAALRKQGRQLETKAKRTSIALAVAQAREKLLEQRIAGTTNPAKLARLEARLARVQDRQARLVVREAQLKKQGKKLAKQGEKLARQEAALVRRAAQLAQQGAALEQQGDQLAAEGALLQQQAAQLQRQGDQLQKQANQLQREGDQLQKQADHAKKQEKTAKKLKRQLTKELTKAGGDDRATDPRVVKLQDATLATPGVVSLLPPQVSKKGDAVVINAIPSTSPSSEQTSALVRTLRSQVIPDATEEGGIQVFVGGYTASGVDLATKISDRLPLVILTVLGLSFLLLLLAFRSLLVPLQAAITNLLSVAASLGVLTAVFQWGWGLSAIGLDAPPGGVPIASYVPLMMFAILFGLSMDYEVFLVSQVVAFHESGRSPKEAVTAGLGASARVISAAALIMICVFGSFILNGDPTVKQFGVGLSVAVLLAATLVLLLAPALLIVFGRAAWHLPHWLDRILPDIGLDEGPLPSDPATPPVASGSAHV